MNFSRGSKIDNLRERLASKGGIQRANRYDIFISKPGLGVLQWPVFSVSLPGRSLEAVPDELRAQGSNPRTIPVRRGYGGEPSLILGMYVDRDWQVRKYFEDWADSFNPIEGKPGQDQVVLKGDYDKLSDAHLFIRFLDLQDKTKFEMAVLEPYVSTIIQDTYSEERLNEFAILNVAIAFKEYVIDEPK
jgi:microsomal dipeptidase-like Zn-dependent dipeptidase